MYIHYLHVGICDIINMCVCDSGQACLQASYLNDTDGVQHVPCIYCHNGNRHKRCVPTSHDYPANATVEQMLSFYNVECDLNPESTRLSNFLLKQDDVSSLCLWLDSSAPTLARPWLVWYVLMIAAVTALASLP